MLGAVATEAEHRLEELVDAVIAISAELTLERVLDRVLEGAVSLAGARYGALGVLAADGTLAEFHTTGFAPEVAAAIGDLPHGHGILGVLIVEPKPLRLRDLNQHPDAYGFPPGHPPMRSFLGVPVVARGAVFGNLYLTEKQDADEFTAEDEKLVVAVAGAAGVAIENARLVAQVNEYAVLADRERIARDLHDLVIQRLFAAGMALQATARMTAEPVSSRLISAVDELDTTIKEIRSTIFALQAPTRPGASLRADILHAASDAAGVLGFEPRLHFAGPIDLGVSVVVGEQLLTVTREALSNVARHANATEVTIDVSVNGDIVLRVTDNGRGMPAEPREQGNGLRNMRARAAALGGACTVEPHRPSGTILTWRVPRLAG